MATTSARTILVTGANRGLGQATSRRLARDGHRLILTARDEAKATLAEQQVRDAAPGAAVSTRVLDLASLASTRALAAALLDAGEPIDVLVHDAGVLFPPDERALTEDGVELCLQVHAVAPLLLTRALLPVLARPSRVWMLGSSLHYPGMRGAEVDYRHDDPNLDTRYHPERAYKNSKLALLWVAYELERRLGPHGVHVDVVSPGFVPATAASGVKRPLMRWAMQHVMPHMPFATTLDDSADHLAKLFGDSPADELGGRYFHEWKPKASSDQSLEPAQAQQFWRWACERAGLPEEVGGG
ncbi:MAG: SDR family NAD(P)-dependent oxidoreductase [Nannocystaceae bacterium]